MRSNTKLFLFGLFIGFIFLVIFTSCGGNNQPNRTEGPNLENIENTSEPTQEILSQTVIPPQVEKNSTVQPTSKNPSTQPAESAQNTELLDNIAAFAFIPYDFTLIDIGNGMNEGHLRIAYKNISQNPDSVRFIDPRGGYYATLETHEGITYTVEIDGLDLLLINTDAPAENAYRIPPGFQINPQINFTWNSAYAATPSRIIFSNDRTDKNINNFPQIIIDLPQNQGESLSYPYTTPPTFTTYDSLAGKKWLTGPVEALYTGRCGNYKYFYPDSRPGTDANASKRFLEVTFFNTDKFKEQTVGSDVYYSSVFYRDGSVFEWGCRDYYSYHEAEPQRHICGRGLTIGPNVTQTMLLDLGSCDSTTDLDTCAVTVHWLSNGGYEIFDLSQCSVIE